MGAWGGGGGRSKGKETVLGAIVSGSWFQVALIAGHSILTRALPAGTQLYN